MLITVMKSTYDTLLPQADSFVEMCSKRDVQLTSTYIRGEGLCMRIYYSLVCHCPITFARTQDSDTDYWRFVVRTC